MLKKVYLLSIASVLMLAPGAYSQEMDMFGVWARGDGKARVRIERCGGDYCAVNTWIKPGTNGEKVGDKLIMDLSREGENKFAGKANDPQRGMSYNIEVTVSGDTMSTRGCVLAKIVCKSVGWTRIE